jgi:hypothetical protein
MPVVPTPAYHRVLSCIMLVGGLVVIALCLVVLIVLWRQGRRGLILLGPTGLAVIAVGLSAAGAVHLLGLAGGTDTVDLALAV